MTIVIACLKSWKALGWFMYTTDYRYRIPYGMFKTVFCWEYSVVLLKLVHNFSIGNNQCVFRMVQHFWGTLIIHICFKFGYLRTTYICFYCILREQKLGVSEYAILSGKFLGYLCVFVSIQRKTQSFQDMFFSHFFCWVYFWNIETPKANIFSI